MRLPRFTRLAKLHRFEEARMNTRTIVQWGLLAVFVAVGAGSEVEAQQYPTKPVRIVAPFGPGGLVDVLARAVGEKLRVSLGQPIVVDNRPGSGGNIGADIVAKAEPDGYTLLMSSAGILSI